MRASAWLCGRAPSRAARIRLFCLPYAGGSAAAYHTFRTGLPGYVDACPIELPGRASRLREKPYTNFPRLIEHLSQVLRDHLQLPYALFGYSMGALVAFELARRVRERGGREPEHLFLAARTPPARLANADRLSHLPEDALLAEMERRYRAIPDVLVQDPGMRSIIVDLMRADLSLLESYEPRTDDAPLSCPLTIFAGTKDPAANPDTLKGWRAATTGPFGLQTFNGGHFFIESHRDAVLRAVARGLVAGRGGVSPILF